ncbi:MAG: FkbM family methyltransferase [Microcoleaceae cyanobacterium]
MIVPPISLDMMKLNLRNLLSQNSVSPKGIIHVGAYEGKDIKLYQALGISKVLFIEANPTVFERLKANIAEASVDVQAVNYAISDRDGEVKLYVNSMGQSSSILPMKHYRDIYPNIQETHQLTVESKTLDTLLQELELSPADFNILNLDIQGTELLALHGATNLLKYIDAIYTKVNYEELYEGCALAEKVDDFLAEVGFGRVAVATPFHPSWGDAFYVKKQVITMSTLGKKGGLGNQIFEYAFLKIYAQENGLSVETPLWVGQELFGHQDREISEELPVVVEENDRVIFNNTEVWKNVDFQGEFLYHTRYYASRQEYFKSLFQPVAEIESQVKVAWEKLKSGGKTIIGLHLQPDTPSEWYKIWLNGLWETLDEPVLFIASDNLEEVPLVYFEEYHPITVQDLGGEVNGEYLDFYLLSNCDFVAISNTAFAFAACLLNEGGKYFFRPHFPTAKLIPFQPWNSTPVFQDVEMSQVGESDLFEATFQQMQSQLQETQAELENTQSQLQQTREEIENIQSQRDQILGELESTQFLVQQNQEKAKTAESQLQQTREELKNTQSQRDEFLGELESTQSLVQQSQEKTKTAESQLQQIREELKNTQSQRDEFLGELEKIQSQLQQNQEKAKTAESQKQQIQTELDKSQSELHNTREELELTQFQLDEVQAELEQSTSQLFKNQEELNVCKSQLQQMQTQLEQTKLKLENQPKLSQNQNITNYAAHIKNLAKILAETIPD